MLKSKIVHLIRKGGTTPLCNCYDYMPDTLISDDYKETSCEECVRFGKYLGIYPLSDEERSKVEHLLEEVNLLRKQEKELSNHFTSLSFFYYFPLSLEGAQSALMGIMKQNAFLKETTNAM